MLNDNGNNYEIWSKAVIILLQSHRLWHMVNSTETAPDMTTNADTYNKWYIKDQDA